MASASAQRIFDAKAAAVLRPERRMYAELMRDQALSTDELHALQHGRAMEMVRLAAGCSPFYRERYRAAGLTTGDLDDQSVLTSVPILEKEDVRGRSPDLHTPEATPGTSRFASTGGSTGEPLKTPPRHARPGGTLSWRLFGWWGLRARPPQHRRDATVQPVPVTPQARAGPQPDAPAGAAPARRRARVRRAAADRPGLAGPQPSGPPARRACHRAGRAHPRHPGRRRCRPRRPRPRRRAPAAPAGRRRRAR